MSQDNRAAFTVLLICCGMMLGAGVGVAFGNVAIGIPAGLALGGLASIIMNSRGR